MARKRRNSAQGKARKAKIKSFLKKGAIMALTGGAALPFLAARSILKKNKSKMKTFVENAGVEPSENVEELATQTAMVREKQINNIVDDNENYPDIQDRDTAETEWEQQQADEEEQSGFDGRESNAFTGAALGAILGVAKGVVGKIKAARAKKGKGFFGKKAGEKSGLDVNVDGDGNLVASGVANGKGNNVVDASINDATSGAAGQMLKKYAPFAIIAILLLLFGKKLFK